MRLLNLLRKKGPNAKETLRDENIRYNYHIMLRIAEVWTDEAEDDKRKTFLTYLINTVLCDLCAEQEYQPNLPDIRLPYSEPFPKDIINEDGEKIAVATGEKIGIDLSVNKTFAYPRDSGKAKGNIARIAKDNSQQNFSNQPALYYTDIDLCCISNNERNSKSGIVEADVRNLELLYPHCTSDGLDWYNIHTMEKLQPVIDYRLAVVYTLARTRAGYKDAYVNPDYHIR